MITLNSDVYLRMVSEKANLEKKVEKLDAFIKKALNGDVEDITKSDIELLQEQLHYMNGYLRVLKIRIQRVFEAHK